MSQRIFFLVRCALLRANYRQVAQWLIALAKHVLKLIKDDFDERNNDLEATDFILAAIA